MCASHVVYLAAKYHGSESIHVVHLASDCHENACAVHVVHLASNCHDRVHVLFMWFI